MTSTLSVPSIDQHLIPEDSRIATRMEVVLSVPYDKGIW